MIRTRHFVKFAAVLIGLLLSIADLCIAASKDFAAVVINTSGIVTATTPDNKSRVLKRAAYLYEHETIAAGNNAKAQIRFTDGSIVAIQANTTFKITAYQFKQAKQKDALALELIKGGFRNVTGSIGHQNPAAVTYHTPTATIGIRGTDTEELISSSAELVRVQSGRIEVDLADHETCQILNAEEALAIDPETLEMEEIADDDQRFDDLDIELPSDEDIAEAVEEASEETIDKNDEATMEAPPDEDAANNEDEVNGDDLDFADLYE